ncbi:hypothetical protein OROMI_025071 [Orobanche minor]
MFFFICDIYIVQEDYNRLRPLRYRGADVLVLAFSLVSRARYENIFKKWISELQHFAPGTSLVLVRTKLDVKMWTLVSLKVRVLKSDENGECMLICEDCLLEYPGSITAEIAEYEVFLKKQN